VATIEFIDQTLRDGQQSLWGMRMRPGQMMPVAPTLDQAGFRVVDTTASVMIALLAKEYREDGFAALDRLAAAMPGSTLRAALRSNGSGNFGLAPDSIMDLWIRTLVKHGMTSFWICDCLYELDKMARVSRVIRDEGATVAPAIMYALSPVHTDEYFAAKAKAFTTFCDLEAVYIEDASGVLTPERTRTLVRAVMAAAPGLPIEMHAHNTTGLAPWNYFAAVEEGVRILHTASRPLANGPSLPSTESMVANMRLLGHDVGVDDAAVEVVSAHFAAVAEREGFAVGVPWEPDLRMYEHQLPGGMTGTLLKQLEKYGMPERYEQVLDEVATVRRELGYPIMATPFSQLMGTQALLNVVTGERYGSSPDEVIMYLLGHYGEIPGPVDPDVRDRILSSPRGRRFEGWEQPQPSLAEVRREYGAHLSDEDLLLRTMLPPEDVDAMRAAGPLATDDDLAGTLPPALVDLIARQTTNYLEVRWPGFAMALARTH
jgi:oxaloacetate decarboxylase (Na+ extruding) subunit alpha